MTLLEGGRTRDHITRTDKAVFSLAVLIVFAALYLIAAGLGWL